MSIKLKICSVPLIIYLFTQVGTHPISNDFREVSVSDSVKQISESQIFDSTQHKIESNNSDSVKQASKSYINEKRATPIYDTITGKDGLLHYRVLFWVPNQAKKFIPYADDGVETDVSSHGPVGKWSVEDTGITNAQEKLVYILVPKTFVFLYGDGFEKVIHLKYN